MIKMNGKHPEEAGCYFARLNAMGEQQDGELIVVTVEGEQPWLEIGAAIEAYTGEVWPRGQLAIGDIEVWGERIFVPEDL